MPTSSYTIFSLLLDCIQLDNPEASLAMPHWIHGHSIQANQELLTKLSLPGVNSLIAVLCTYYGSLPSHANSGMSDLENGQSALADFGNLTLHHLQRNRVWISLSAQPRHSVQDSHKQLFSGCARVACSSDVEVFCLKGSAHQGAGQTGLFTIA